MGAIADGFLITKQKKNVHFKFLLNFGCFVSFNEFKREVIG